MYAYCWRQYQWGQWIFLRRLNTAKGLTLSSPSTDPPSTQLNILPSSSQGDTSLLVFWSPFRLTVHQLAQTNTQWHTEALTWVRDLGPSLSVELRSAEYGSRSSLFQFWATFLPCLTMASHYIKSHYVSSDRGAVINTTPVTDSPSAVDSFLSIIHPYHFFVPDLSLPVSSMSVLHCSPLSTSTPPPPPLLTWQIYTHIHSHMHIQGSRQQGDRRTMEL